MRQGDITPHAYVACFDAATGASCGERRSAPPTRPPVAAATKSRTILLTLVGRSHLLQHESRPGRCARCHDGSICWLRRYERRCQSANWTPVRLEPLHFESRSVAMPLPRRPRDCRPLRYADDFRARCRHRQNSLASDQLPDALHLLGVVRRNLIVTGNRLAAIDVRSGQAAIRLAGERACRHSRHGPRPRGRRRSLLADSQRNLRDPRHDRRAKAARRFHSARSAMRAPTWPQPMGDLSSPGPDKLMTFGPELRIPPKKMTEE